MKKKWSIFVYFVLLLILGISCNTSTTPTVTPKSSINWWTLWLDHPVCKAPCWMNITPGVMSMSEAVSILENKPEVIITHKSKLGVSWRFDQNKTDSGDMRQSGDGNVSSIWLGNSREEALHFETIVTEYGYPSFVELYDCREGICSTILVYSDVGLLVDVALEDNNPAVIETSQVNIQPNIVVSGVYFISPGLENFKKIPEFQEQDLLEWKGYGEYP